MELMSDTVLERKMTTTFSKSDSLVEQAMPTDESTAIHESVTTENVSAGVAGAMSAYEKMSTEQKRELMYEGQGV
jgi:hypothetical protein